MADEPTGYVGDVVLPVAATGIFPSFNWVKGIRVQSATNDIEGIVDRSRQITTRSTRFAVSLAPGTSHYEQEIAVFDDSIQPIGFGSGFSHIKMKKLRHSLTLAIDGPDEDRIRTCVEQALSLGLVAAIAAVYLTGGAAFQAAVSSLLTHLQNCLGDSFQVRINNSSQWIEWCT